MRKKLQGDNTRLEARMAKNICVSATVLILGKKAKEAAKDPGLNLGPLRKDENEGGPQETPLVTAAYMVQTSDFQSICWGGGVH